MDEQKFKIEKAKARKLRQSQWWKAKIQACACHYCGGRFMAEDLTMDHIVHISRAGKSNRGNLVPACKKCNVDKKYYTPAEIILREKLGQDIQF